MTHDVLLTPLPSSPARGEVPTEDVGRCACKQPDRNTSPLAGEDGRGVSPDHNVLGER